MRAKITPWRVGIAGLSLYSFYTTLWNLHKGHSSDYYAAIATSMSRNLGNFFFGALDPAGTVTLDKIPGSFWIPAIFVRIFGVHTLSFNAPNALATIAAAIIIAFTFRKLVGPTGGLIAGFIYASTPIVVAVGRSNQPQSFFLLTLALVLWRATIAFETQKRRDLIITGAMIALAFHTYMLEAWAVWPALIIAWFFTQKELHEKIRDLLISGLISLGLSLTWIIAVFIFPASHRPYIGGTNHNNPLEMVFGYNGLGRFALTTKTLSSETDNPTFRSFTPPFGGHPGWGRLFNYQVSGQIAWLLPAAILAIVVAFISQRHRRLVIFLTGWFVIFFAMFSQVGGIHQFYVSSLALPIAGLIALAYADIHARGRDWLFAIIIGATAIWAMYLTAKYSGYMDKAAIVQVVIAVIAVGVLYMHFSRAKQLMLPVALVLALTLTPAVWAIDTQNYPSSINPIAGPQSAIGGMGGNNFGGRPPQFAGGRNFNNRFGNGVYDNNRPNFDPRGYAQFGGQPGGFNDGQPGGGFNGGAPGGVGQQDNSALITYLKKNRGGAKFLLVVFGGMNASPFILLTQDNIMPVGGFDGQDPTPTLSKFKELVAKGDIKYVLAGGAQNRGGPGQGSASSNSILQWVQNTCTLDSAAPTSNLYICSK